MVWPCAWYGWPRLMFAISSQPLPLSRVTNTTRPAQTHVTSEGHRLSSMTFTGVTDSDPIWSGWLSRALPLV